VHAWESGVFDVPQMWRVGKPMLGLWHGFTGLRMQERGL
jgi:hypothetical protein